MDGLTVTAFPEKLPGKRIPAIPNRSGTYTVHAGTGLTEFEGSAGDLRSWSVRPTEVSFLLEVIDAERRFLPCVVPVRVPFRGLFQSPCVSPAGSFPGIELYSAPARTVPAGLAVARAELREAVSRRPAAWAMLEVRTPDGRGFRGLADDEGRVAVIFPYPEPIGFMVGSPSVRVGPPLTEQSWTISVRARYSALSSGEILPDLCEVERQSPATLWVDTALTRECTAATLQFGRELILRSEDATTGTSTSELLISLAGSPP
jgi:hypothetical protein